MVGRRSSSRAYSAALRRVRLPDPTALFQFISATEPCMNSAGRCIYSKIGSGESNI